MGKESNTLGSLNGRWVRLHKIDAVVTLVLLPVVGTLALMVSSISANRFTAQDGLDVWKEIGSIRTAMAGMPHEAPPEWFRNQVQTMAADVREMRGIASALVERVDGLRTDVQRLDKALTAHVANHGGGG